jgi:hypothetical protein
MSKNEAIPLLSHPLGLKSEFTPEALVSAVRAERGLPAIPIPDVCVLDFDGDLTDWMVSAGAAHPCRSWACFHTSMFSTEADFKNFKSSGIRRKAGSVGSIPMHLRHNNVRVFSRLPVLTGFQPDFRR